MATKFPNNLGKDIVTIRHGHFVDVWWGRDGWTPHASMSIQRGRNGKYLEQVSGDLIPKSVLSTVHKNVGV